jgi:hypothetical protein
VATHHSSQPPEHALQAPVYHSYTRKHLHCPARAPQFIEYSPVCCWRWSSLSTTLSQIYNNTLWSDKRKCQVMVCWDMHRKLNFSARTINTHRAAGCTHQHTRENYRSSQHGSFIIYTRHTTEITVLESSLLSLLMPLCSRFLC